MRETPSISNSSYSSNSTSFADAPLQSILAVGSGAQQTLGGRSRDNLREMREDIAAAVIDAAFKEEAERTKTMAATRRLVKVIIIDSNENVPLADCVLYSGEEKLTDATDQELFFELDIKKLLDEHNKKRVKVVDKKVKERVEHLEPAKVRDLKMVVVDIAKF
jgi:hypothetical protein